MKKLNPIFLLWLVLLPFCARGQGSPYVQELILQDHVGYITDAKKLDDGRFLLQRISATSTDWANDNYIGLPNMLSAVPYYTWTDSLFNPISSTYLSYSPADIMLIANKKINSSYYSAAVGYAGAGNHYNLITKFNENNQVNWITEIGEFDDQNQESEYLVMDFFQDFPNRLISIGNKQQDGYYYKFYTIQDTLGNQLKFRFYDLPYAQIGLCSRFGNGVIVNAGFRPTSGYISGYELQPDSLIELWELPVPYWFSRMSGNYFEKNKGQILALNDSVMLAALPTYDSLGVAYLKFSSSGHVYWQGLAGLGTGKLIPQKIELNADGSFYVACLSYDANGTLSAPKRIKITENGIQETVINYDDLPPYAWNSTGDLQNNQIWWIAHNKLFGNTYSQIYAIRTDINGVADWSWIFNTDSNFVGSFENKIIYEEAKLHIFGTYMSTINPNQSLINTIGLNNLNLINYSLNPEFTIYPNPCTDFLYINSQNQFLNRFEILDSTGKKVIFGNSNISYIDVTNINPGIYFFYGYSKNKNYKPIKFIKL